MAGAIALTLLQRLRQAIASAWHKRGAETHVVSCLKQPKPIPTQNTTNAKKPAHKSMSGLRDTDLIKRRFYLVFNTLVTHIGHGNRRFSNAKLFEALLEGVRVTRLATVFVI